MNLFAFKGPEQPLRPELVTMRQLLESANTTPALVWRAMGVKDLIYDNARCFLLWTMGTGAKVARVKFSYNEEWDLYELEFYGHVADTYHTYADTLDADWSQVIQRQRNKVLAGIYVSDVIRTIEEHTGFYLSV